MHLIRAQVKVALPLPRGHFIARGPYVARGLVVARGPHVARDLVARGLARRQGPNVARNVARDLEARSHCVARGLKARGHPPSPGSMRDPRRVPTSLVKWASCKELQLVDEGPDVVGTGRRLIRKVRRGSLDADPSSVEPFRLPRS